MTLNISPAFLTGNLQEVSKHVAQLQTAGFQTLQFDICDGSYSPEQTLTPQDLVEIDFQGMQLDFHLITEEPMDYVWELEEFAPRLPIRAVYGQIERMSYQEAFLEEVKKHNWQAGLAVDLFTPLSSITPESWDWLDTLLLLSVEAGEQGQPFQSSVLEKVQAAQRKIIQNAEPVKICIDGGVNLELLDKLRQAGVQEVAVGAALFTAPNFLENAKKFVQYNQE